MAGIRLNGRAYGGVATVANADHLMCEDGSGNVINAQTMIQNILGDMANIEQSDTASKAYAVGDYLMYNSKFYKVTSAITQGDTIVPNTNVVKTTVADEFSNASNISYDNTESGLTATNAQDALDEINSLTGGCVLYKTIGTHFPELVKNSGEMAIIYAQRLSVDSCAIYAVHNYNGTIHTKEVYNSGLFTIATNSVGTVSILYNNAALNVYAVAIKY